MENVLVSVIIPTYNREKTIKRSINSVLNQTIEDFEIIVVDDRSTDSTKEIIREYQKKDNRIKYVINKNLKGPAGARNMGIREACGKYIAFLDSDDKWEEFHLEDSINLMKKTDSAACFAYWYEKHGDFVEDLAECKEIKDKLNEAIKALCVKDYGDYFCLESSFLEYSIISYFYCYHINTLVMKRECIQKTGKFKEDLFTSEDVDLVLRIIDTCKVVEDKEIVRRLTLDGENKNKMRKYIIKLYFSF